ncbi:hypothetical protein HK104_009477 [Borealophlyctis nickersoniae]|nr:hypothetical protein HK104_009477 [Borealophlyctis nickersoniae]
MEPSSTARREEDAVKTINRLLTHIRVPIKLRSLRECVASLWVALFEGLFETRIHGIIRDESATTRGARIRNVQLVLDELAGVVLNVELGHIKAEALVDGETESVLDLVDVFGEILDVMQRTEFGVEEEVETGDWKGKGPAGVEESSYSDLEWDLEDFSASAISFDEGYETQPIAVHPFPEEEEEEVGRVSDGESRVSEHTADPERSVEDASIRQNASQTGSGRSTQSTRRRSDSDAGDYMSVVNDDVEEYVQARARQQQRTKMQAGGNHAQKYETKRPNTDAFSTPLRSRKRIRFDLKKTNDTPPLLRVQPSDTPHTKALKIRRARLLREFNQTQANTAKIRTPRKLLRMYKASCVSPRTRLSPYHGAYRAQKAQSNSRWTVRQNGFGGARPNTRASEEQFSADSEEEDGSDYGDRHYADGSVDEEEDEEHPQSIPEQNLAEYNNMIRQELPTVRIPKRTKERVWNDQIKTWEKALDDRVWTRTVNRHKHATGAGDPKPLQHLLREIEQSVTMKQRQQAAAAQKAAKAELAERHRRVVRLEQQRKAAEDEVRRIVARRRFKDEQIVKDIFDDYVKSQRKAIIEERRREKNEKNAKAAALRQKEEAKEN